MKFAFEININEEQRSLEPWFGPVAVGGTYGMRSCNDPSTGAYKTTPEVMQYLQDKLDHHEIQIRSLDLCMQR